MKFWTDDGKTYRLHAETPMDTQFLGALNQDGQALQCVALTHFNPDGEKHWEIDGCVLQVDPSTPASVRADAGRQVLSALGQLMRLGLGEAANHLVARTPPADPQPQEQFAACLVQLQVVTASLLGIVGGQQEFVGKEVVGTHGVAPVVKTAIVGVGGMDAQGGAA